MDDAEDDRGPSVKRKKENPQENTNPYCVIHYDGFAHGPLKLFNEDKNAAAKFAKLQTIKQQRQAEPITSSHRMQEQCSLLPEQISDIHGYHWNCYKRFTGNLNRLRQKSEGFQESIQEKRASRRSCNEKDHVIFNPDCIFCGSDMKKAIKMKGSWTTQNLSQFQSDSWKSVLEMAERKNDHKLLTRIRGHDLFACEAKFHRRCMIDYMQAPEKWRSHDENAKRTQDNLSDAHRKAFEDVCQAVNTEVFQQNKVLRLSHLQQIYITSLEETDHRNQKYRSENLKSKLIKQFGDQLMFCDMGMPGQFQSAIIFSSSLGIDTAVKQAYMLGSSHTIESVGITMHTLIKESYEKSPPLKWPPTPQDLEVVHMPDELIKLLSFVICGSKTPTSSHAQRLVLSIGQDICRASTNGSWKLAKHALMALSLRHLFRSKTLIRLLHRLGHCESYDFSLELETALAEAVESSSSQLSNQIIRYPVPPSVFHSEFDNFDKFINDVSGRGSIHTAHGIMLQEVTSHTGQHQEGEELQPLPRTKHRSFSLTKETTLPECYVSQKQNPKLKITQLTHPDGPEAMAQSLKMTILWILLRSFRRSEGKPITAWSGFISNTHNPPKKLTTIDYYPVINHPITEYSTIQECLRAAEEATKEVGQEYVITTFDMGVCMKALPLIWQNPERYKKHVILPGTFHLECAFMKMLGKKMKGSGFEDILLEAGLISGGSLVGVMQGKNYDRAIHCHKVMLEALEGLLFEECTQNEDHPFSSLTEESRKKIDTLSQEPSPSALSDAVSDAAITDVVDNYMEFSKTDKGPTAKFWMSYMYHVHLLLALIKSVKTNDYLLYVQTIKEMCPIFFSFGGQNYARYMTYFSAFLANIDNSHAGASDLIRLGTFSVARSFIPGNRCATDKTMEETFMRHAKSHGGAGEGLTGILTNYNAYQRWVRTTHLRSLYVNATFNMADLGNEESDGNRHRDLRPTEIQRSNREVRKTKDAIKAFLNPFSSEVQNELIILSSGAAAPKDIATDVLEADQRGIHAHNQFIDSRLKTSKNFFTPVKRMNLKTLADSRKFAKSTAAKNLVIKYKEQGTIAFKLLVKTQNDGLQLNMKELMAYPLTTMPFSIATADNYLIKTDKAKAFHYLVRDQPDANIPPSSETLTVYDGNAYFHNMMNIPGTFAEICSKLFDSIASSGDILFSTDQYKPGSIKSLERKRRGCGEKLIIASGATKRPTDWKLFLANDDNKVQFIRLLLTLWSSQDYAVKLQGRKVILICEDSAHLLTSDDGITTKTKELTSLRSSHEETDTRVVLYTRHAASRGYKNIRIKTPDSDIFFVLLHFASTIGINILFDTKIQRKSRLINVTSIAANLGQEKCSALLGLHGFTGSDTSSAFRGKGKLVPLKKMLKTPKFVTMLAKLGDNWNVSEDLIDDLEVFTCSMYGDNSVAGKVNDLRLNCINKLCTKKEKSIPGNVDMSSLPPCRKSLTQHIRRVNYQVALWKRANIANPTIPSPVQGHGWLMTEDGLHPLWYEGESQPQNLQDICQEQEDIEETYSDSDSDTESESDEPDDPTVTDSDTDYE